MRVVSLVPSLTETLFELGAGDDVVGITDYCIFPPGLQLPRVGGTKSPDIAQIRELRPDLVYMNSEENLKRHADEIATFARVHTSEPKTVDDVITLVGELGAIHGKDAMKLTGEIIAARLPLPSSRFTFLIPIWKKPWMWCGGDTYVSNLVETIGGRNLLGHQKRYPAMDLESALALQPEVILLPDEPYEFTVEDAADFDELRIIGPFPGHLVTWHGARTREGLRFLRSVMR